jgi:uncharacterized Rossmann fold enzyme
VNSKTQPKDEKRREFIKKSTLVGAGLAATAVASTGVIADVDTTSSDKPEQKGYQLTQHVLDYYKSSDL